MANQDQPERLTDRQLQEVVERAARLAEAERAGGDLGHSPAEVATVAAELELSPRHVEAAMAGLADERARDEIAARARRERRRTGLLLSGALACVLAAGAGAVGLGAAGDVRAAADQVTARSARLGAALDRQIRLVPSLLAAAGARVDALEGAAADAGLVAREDLARKQLQAAAVALAALPAPTTPAGEQQRLSLGYELTGAENRVSAERAQLEIARAQWAAISATVPARLALLLGFAQAPR